MKCTSRPPRLNSVQLGTKSRFDEPCLSVVGHIKWHLALGSFVGLQGQRIVRVVVVVVVVVKLLISVKNYHHFCRVVLIHGRLQSRHKLIKGSGDASEGPVVGDHSFC